MYGHSSKSIGDFVSFLIISAVTDKALFTPKHWSVNKYFKRSSVESEAKSQVVTVPKVPA